MNYELAQERKGIIIDEKQKTEILKNCPSSSFRVATKFIIDSLEKEIKLNKDQAFF